MSTSRLKTKVIVRSAKQLGNALQRFRREQDWPQVRLSEQSGVKQATISQVESGAEGSRLETLFKLLAGLDLEIVVQPRTKTHTDS